MLHVHVYALGLDARHLGGAGLAGDEGVLGVVLEVAPGIGGAVDVHTGAVDAGIGFTVGQQAVVAHTAAHRLRHRRIKGGGQQVLGGIAGGGAAAGEGGGDALGAVFVLGGGLGHAGHGDGAVVGLADEPGHLVEGHLVHQVVPGVTLAVHLGGAVQGHADELGQVEGALLAHGWHGAGGVLLVQGVHEGHHFVAGGELGGGLVALGGDVRLGHGALPVGAGEVDDIVSGIAVKTV